MVLIVAKCNVNLKEENNANGSNGVLIVAKCNVNQDGYKVWKRSWVY